MRLSAAVLAVVPLAAVLAAAAPPHRVSPPAIDGASSRRAAEVQRIRAHFDSVLAELPRRDVSDLTPAQRTRRAALLAAIGAYRDRGEFPHNYDFPGRAVPYFVDRETGTLCAVAHLLATTGRRDLVDRVASVNNNVYVAQLAGDTAFTGWLAASGLTLDEAARIQVPYVGDPSPSTSAASQSRGAGYTAGSAVAIAGSLAASVWNARANAAGGRRVGTVLGMTAGAAALGLGAASLGTRGAAPSLGVANVAAGAASVWLSTRGMVRHRRVAAREREAAPRAAVAPIVPVDGRSGAGVAVRVGF